VPFQSLKTAKQRFRKSILEVRNKQPPDRIIDKSDQIITRFMNLEEYKAAKVVMLYSGKEKEVQTEKLIRATLKEKRVILPITNKEQRILELSEIKNFDELEKATFNILEPKKGFIRLVAVDNLDLIVVPGVAFDYNGNRMGYGFAYYDKLLSTVKKPILFIALAFQFQVLKTIPHSRHDIRVHVIITEEQIIRC
jgi:5-formyltetrahydrofolate cyclo-ligase